MKALKALGGIKRWWPLAGLLLGLATAQAADVVLVPGTINGSVTITGVTDVDRLDIQANEVAGSNTAYANYYTTDYSLTVNVPQGGSTEYYVYPSLYTSGYRNYMSFPPQIASVGDGVPATLDFSVDPGFLTGTITLTGAELSYGYVYASGSGGGYSRGALTVDPNNVHVGTYLFPALPDSSMQVYGNIYDTNGKGYSLEQATLNVAGGATVTKDWAIEAGTASISGVLELTNGGPVGNRYLYAYGPNGAYAYIYPTDSSYAFTGLDGGDWTIYAYSYLNSYDDYFRHPDRTVSNLQAGEARTFDIIDQAAFLNGSLVLSGSKGLADLSSAEIDANGIYNTPTQGGYARDNVNTADGAIDLLVSGGDWRLEQLRLSFYDPAPGSYVNSYVYVYNDVSQMGPVSVANGQTLNLPPLVYQTGTVTVNFSVADGVTLLSNPRLNAYCLKYDNNNNQVFYAYGYAYGPSDEVLLGKATFVGIPADCQLTAEATVNGTTTTFGQLNVTVLPGTDIVQDIGGPTLTILTPAPESYTTAASVDVTGTATDDVEVATVTVNGVAATVIPSGNLSDPIEVNFSHTLALNMGPNTVQTVATDTSGKSSSDTRTVYRDGSSPTLNWTPSNGSNTTSGTATVQGTATDDAGISAIKVNNVAVSFSSSNNPGDPNEVQFSTTVSLANGGNDIQVSATDISKLTTTETHTVTKVAAALACDVDGDVDIDKNDLGLIATARNQQASGADDPRDPDRSGWITVLDYRICALRCTKPKCAP